AGVTCIRPSALALDTVLGLNQLSCRIIENTTAGSTGGPACGESGKAPFWEPGGSKRAARPPGGVPAPQPAPRAPALVAEREGGDVIRLVALVCQRSLGDVAGVDRVEHVERAHHLGARRLGALVGRQRRERVEGEFAEASLGAGDLAVIGGREARRVLVVL